MSGELPADLATPTADPGDRHLVVARRLVSQPGDGRGLCPPVHRDALCPRHGPAPHGHGVTCDGGGHLRRQGFVGGREVEEHEDLGEELLFVGRLLPGTAGTAGVQPPLVGGVGALSLEVALHPLDRGRRRPHTQADPPSPLACAHDAVVAGGLDPARGGWIARREQHPARRDLGRVAVGTLDPALGILGRALLTRAHGTRV